MRTKFSILLLAAVLLTSLVSLILPVQALPPLTPADPIQIGQVGGVTNAVALAGDHLFFNVGPRIERSDVLTASPGAPILPGVLSNVLPGIPLDIKVANGYIYTAMGMNGIAIVDANSMQIITSDTLPLNENAAAVAVGPQYLYVASGNSGVSYYDLGANKNQLTYQGSKTFFNPGRFVTDVETLAGNLYVSANNNAALPVNRGGVLKFNISGSPVLGTPVSTKEQIDINALAVSSLNVFATSDNTLYVLGAASLTDVGSVPATHSGMKITLSPDGKSVYLLGAAGIDVVDVSTAASPVLKTASPFFTQGYTTDLAVGTFQGNSNLYLYIADYFAGLSIARSTQATPQNITFDSPSYALPQPGISRIVAGSGLQAFTDSNILTLQTINTSNISTINPAGPGVTPPSGIYSLAVSQNQLLAAAGFSGIVRYQISAGNEPFSPATYPLFSGSAFSLAVSGSNALVAAGPQGLEVVNISGVMSEVGHTTSLPDFNSNFQKVDWQGDYAYIADGNGTFRIYDMTDPTGPTPTNGKLTQAGINDVKVSGDFAFLACGMDGVKVVDVTDKANPVFISGAVYDTAPGAAQSVLIFKNYLFVAAGTSGVVILTIQPDGHLNYITNVPTSGNALQLALVPNVGLYVATENAGVTMIRTPLIMTNISYLPIIEK